MKQFKYKIIKALLDISILISTTILTILILIIVSNIK